MAEKATVTLRVVPLGDFEPGIWCPQCFLPSAGRMTIAVELAAAGKPLWLQTVCGCPDCGWQEGDDDA